MTWTKFADGSGIGIAIVDVDVTSMKHKPKKMVSARAKYACWRSLFVTA
jgi:hypothetical protein